MKQLAYAARRATASIDEFVRVYREGLHRAYQIDVLMETFGTTDVMKILEALSRGFRKWNEE